jgi:hypothetical protein
MLFLALIARENAPVIKGYPEEVDDRIRFAVNFYSEKLQSHFKQESKIWEYVRMKHPALIPLIDELQAERNEINLLFRSLSPEGSETDFFALGPLLEKHVRKEERQLFQQIQSVADENDLAWIESVLDN